MAITIYDIARKTNTNHGTVSRALRNHPSISQETRQRIKDTAAQMGYRPSHAGKLLKSGKTDTIGLIIPDFTNPYYVNFLKIIQEEAARRGYQTVSIDYGMDVRQEYLCLEQMLERRCDGIIAFLNNLNPVMELIGGYWKNQLPCVVIGGANPDILIDQIGVNINSGIYQAVDHLVGLGHRNIVLVESWPKGYEPGRIPGFQKALKRHRLKCTPKNIFYQYSGSQLEDGRQAAETIFADNLAATAVIVSNDLVMQGLLCGLKPFKLRVPEDISLVSTDNTWVARYSQVPVTSIDLKTSETARRAMEILFDRLKNGHGDQPARFIFEAELIVRESTGAVRKKT